MAASKTETITAAEYRARNTRKPATSPLAQMVMATHAPLVWLTTAPVALPSPEPQVIIEHEPMGAPRMVQSDKWKGREVVTRYHAAKDAIRNACEAQGYRLAPILIVRFEISMPPSWSQKKRNELRGQPHQQKPDCDNCTKLCMDAFNEDDSHVHTIHASKVWADTGRIIITP